MDIMGYTSQKGLNSGTLTAEQKLKYADLDAQDPQIRKLAMEQTPSYAELNAMDADNYAKKGQIKPETSYTAPAVTTPTQQKVSYTKPDGTTAKGYTEVAAEEPQEEPQVSYLDAMRDMYTKIYEEQSAANNEAAAAAAANALKNIETQIESLNAGYQQTNKQLYRDRMEAERVLPQQMAAQGYTGGLTESGRLQLAASYGEALAQNERARLGQAAELNAEGAQAQYQAQAAAAEANAAARVQRDQSYIALEQQRQSDLAANAETMAAVGDFSGYRALGYSQSEVDYLTKLWLSENPSYKAIWMQQHPEEAARLGVKRSGGGSYTQAAAQAEPEVNSSDITTADVYQDTASGAISYKDALGVIDAYEAGGQVGPTTAAQMRVAAQSGGLEAAYQAIKEANKQPWYRNRGTTDADRDANAMLGG